MIKVTIGRYGFKCEEKEYMTSTWGIGSDGKFHIGETKEEVIVKENKFYYAYGSQCNEDWEVQYVIFFMWNGKIIVGEYYEDDTIYFYDMDEEELNCIPKEIEEKAIKYCHCNCNDKYAEF